MDLQAKITAAISPEIGKMAQALEQAGVPLYLVGGAVRDALMGRVPGDVDACGPALPEQVLEACARAGLKAEIRSSELGTLVLHQNKTAIEYTPFRQERYAPGGAHRPEDVTLGVSLEEDALRRDFTVGAIYYRLATQTLIDPLGGVDAIQQKRLSYCAEDTFRADGLRVLRLVRQAAELGFTPDEATFSAAKAAVPLLRDIVPERRQAEFTRILLADLKHPDGTIKGLELITQLGAWPSLVPQLLEGAGIEQRAEFHAYDVFEHSLHACAAAPPTLTLRLAGLLHDVGKPKAVHEGGRMLGHDKLGAAMIPEILGQQGLRYSRRVVERVQMLVEKHMFDLDGRAKPGTVRMRFAAWGMDFADEWIALREADVRGSGREKGDWQTDKHRRILSQMQTDGTPLSLSELAVKGPDLLEMGFSGRAVGEMLFALWMDAVKTPSLNRRAALLSRARNRTNGAAKGKAGRK